MQKLAGKTTFVTGGGSGIGLGIAKALLGAGVRLPTSGRVVVRVDPDDAPQLIPVTDHLKALGFEVVAGDITADALVGLGYPIGRVDPTRRLEGASMVLAAGRGASDLRKQSFAARLTTYTTIAGLAAGARAIARLKAGSLTPRNLQEVPTEAMRIDDVPEDAMPPRAPGDPVAPVGAVPRTDPPVH